MQLKSWKRKLLISLFLFFVTTSLYGDVTLTDEEQRILLDRLKRDKQLIQLYSTRETLLRKETPKFSYTVKDNKVSAVIEIPVYKDNPLTYNLDFVLKQETHESIFPLTFFVGGFIESGSGIDADIKVGVSVVRFSFIQLDKVYLNALVGGKSSGISISYKLSNKLSNTSIHLYTGYAYSLHTTYGVGVSVHF